MERKFILNFIKRHTIAVLSTVTPQNTSESAVIHFAINDNFEIIFNTYVSYRKYKNLNHHNAVSVVIGWDEDITVQYEGKAQELQGKELVQCKEIFHQYHPISRKWDQSPETRYFKVVPTWVRYSDLRGFEKRKVIEIGSFPLN